MFFKVTEYIIEIRFKRRSELRLLSFIIIALLLNYILQFVFNVDRQLYRFQNHDFYQQNGDFDYVAFGPSDCLNTFDTQIIESKYNRTAFNFGGTGISYKQIIRYLFDSKVQDIPIGSTVIFFIPYYEIGDSDESPRETYYQYLSIDPINKGKMYFSSSMDAGALERAFPWQELYTTPYSSSYYDDCYHVLGEGFVNVRTRISQEYHDFDLSVINKPGSYHYYRGNGFATIEVEAETIVDNNELSILAKEYQPSDGPITIDNKAVASIEYVITECIRRGLFPVVVMGPRRADSILSDPNYFTSSNTLKQLSEEDGALYVDMNLIREEIYRSDIKNHWHNVSHFNASGARAFTVALIDTINILRNNEMSAEELFYLTPNEYVESYY